MELIDAIKEFIKRILENSHTASADELETAKELVELLINVGCLR